jgi:translocator protein
VNSVTGKSPAVAGLALALLLVLCLGVGFVGSIATASSIADWYPGLAKPSWTPDSSVFAPVWTALYIIMAVAAWLVWRKGMRYAGVRAALALFGAQLLLNLLWPFLFFALRSPEAGLLGIGALLVSVAFTTWAFFGLSRWAGLLMLPYLAWVAFASLLNLAIWRMN